MREREKEVGGERGMRFQEYKTLSWLGLKGDLCTGFGGEMCGGDDCGEQVI